MALTLMIENISNDTPLYSSEKPETAIGESYYKFYQLRLRQILTRTRYRREQEARIARQKQFKNQSIDNRLSEQRLHKEYMNNIRERSKIHIQEKLTNKNDDKNKRSDSVLSNSNRTNTLSITSSYITTSMELRPKSILKTKQTSIPPKIQRIISAPISSQKNITKSKIIPTIKIDYVDETLSKANIHSFTQATSSSQNFSNKKYHHTQQSILDTIMLHLKSYEPSNISNLPTYEDINNKFSSSIGPTVYRNFERIIL